MQRGHSLLLTLSLTVNGRRGMRLRAKIRPQKGLLLMAVMMPPWAGLMATLTKLCELPEVKASVAFIA